MYSDLRGFLAKLEEEKDLARVRAEVDQEYEIGAIMRKVFDKRGKAILFENVRGSRIPFLCGALGTYRRFAWGLGCPPDVRSIIAKMRQGIKNPTEPRVVPQGVCQENVRTGKEIDLGAFPAPLWNPLDGGRYIGTMGVSIVRDPETGKRNVGIYRHQFEGRDRMGLNATQQIGTILRKYLDRNLSMPVAVVFGLDPVIIAAACIQAPLGQDELTLAGGLKGKPIELVQCQTIDLEVPASAEVVFEGKVPPDPALWEIEGPLGEYTGFYGGIRRKRATIHMTAVTHRDNPIFQGTLEGRPPSESVVIRSVGYSIGVHGHLERAAVPGFKEAYATEMGSASSTLIIKLDKQYHYGNARQAMKVAWASTNKYKWIIVVDGDVDIFDRGQVEWALGTRVQPHRDIVILENEPGIDLDASICPEDREYPNIRGSRIGIDATKEFKGFEFPPEALPSPENSRKVEERWKEYGID